MFAPTRGLNMFACKRKDMQPVQTDVSKKQAQFDALVRTYSADLFRYAVWLSRDRTLADDLVQETFLRAWRAIDSLRDQKAAKGWLITILRREHARIYERKTPYFWDVDGMELEDRREPGPDDDMDTTNLRRAIMQLDQKYREPLFLQVVGGYSCQEIADMLDVSRSAVMTQLFRGRQKLQKVFKDDEQSESVANGLP